MQLTHINYNLREHFFSNIIVVIWNSLPNAVVSAESTNTFKNCLDKFWANQDFKFDWKADIAGIGSRSINRHKQLKLCLKVLNCVQIRT